MPIAPASKADRRRIADEFKQRKVPLGIYSVTCSATGEKWVGSSPNLSAAQNSLWFQLRSGRYRNIALQQAWKQHGETSFSLEILEQFDDDTPPLLLNDLYAAKKKEWTATLGAQIV